MHLICSAFLRFVDRLISSICLKAPSPLECKGTVLKAAVNLGATLDLYGQQGGGLSAAGRCICMHLIYLQIRLHAAEWCLQAGKNFSV